MTAGTALKRENRTPVFRGCFAALLLVCVLSAFVGACHKAPRPTVTLSVAASLQDAIAEVEATYQRDHGAVDFRNNFGSSGTLAREIEDGAPVDALIAAGAKPMDDLQAKGLLAPGTREDLLRNTLVLIAPLDSKLQGFDGLKGKDVRLLALGDPASVPAGQYGKQTLDALHLYDTVSTKIVLAKDVRQVLTYVETGNADAGLVYGTDARISTRVRIIAVAPDSSHDPIVYPIAVVKGSRNEEAARRFLVYLGSPAARDIFLQYGFRMA